MAKRPSLLETLQHDTPKSAEASSAPVTKLKTDSAKTEVVKSTVYFPKPVHEKLREIAFSQNCKVHDLVLEGLSHVLKEHGYAGVEELKQQKK